MEAIAGQTASSQEIVATAIEQLEAMRRLGENWDGYAAATPNAQAITLAQELVALIEDLLKNRGSVPVPVQVSPTRVGGVLIEWLDATFDHEVQIDPDGSISFLHHHRATGAIATRRFAPEPTVVQAGFLHELRQLLAA